MPPKKYLNERFNSPIAKNGCDDSQDYQETADWPNDCSNDHRRLLALCFTRCDM